MVAGQHHLRLDMYVAQAVSGHFEVVENLGMIDPRKPSPPTNRVWRFRFGAARMEACRRPTSNGTPWF